MAQSQPIAGDTIDVKQAHRFDEARLTEYLRTTVDGFEGPLTVRQFEGGQSNPTYFLTTPARNYVLRRKPPGRLVKSAHAVEREWRVPHALNQTDFPVPHAYVLCEDPDSSARSFFVMSHVPGHARTDPSMPDLAPVGERSLGGRDLAALRYSGLCISARPLLRTDRPATDCRTSRSVAHSMHFAAVRSRRASSAARSRAPMRACSRHSSSRPTCAPARSGAWITLDVGDLRSV